MVIELFPGEKLEIDDALAAVIKDVSDEVVNSKYAKGEVRIVTEQARYPLTAIPGMLDSKSKQYKLNPEFQRRHRWNNIKKSRLIESFIMNVPVPPIFLYEYEFSNFEVMDGLQRLTAINSFYLDKFALEGLQEWPELNGRYYSTLPEQVRRGVDRRYLSSIVLLQETAKTLKEAQRLKQLVFERINSGGVTLEPQESRNATYPGPLNDLCIKLARTPELCRTWGIPEPTEEELTGGSPSEELIENQTYSKMDDVELVLRFFAYRQRLSNQRGALKDFFDNFLKQGNLWPQNVRDSLRILFIGTISLAENLFGEKAFWLWRSRKNAKEGGGWYQRPTTVVYDPLMFELSKRLKHEHEFMKRKDEIREELTKFYDINSDKFEGRYTNISNIDERNRLFGEFLDRFVG